METYLLPVNFTSAKLNFSCIGVYFHYTITFITDFKMGGAPQYM